MNSSPFINQVRAWLDQQVTPVANAIDSDSEQLRAVFAAMAQQGWLALRRPVEFGGPDLAEPEWREFQEAIARASGALAFLQTQHQSAVAMIARSHNQALKQRTLPSMHDGTVTIAIGFSQLRRPGPPLLRAKVVPGGFRLDGHLPWITGQSFFQDVLLAAQLPDGSAVFGITPFADADGPDGGTLRLSAPMRLAAMGAARTVTADLTGWHLPEDQVVFQRPAGWIHTNDTINIALQGFFAIGCAQGSLDQVEALVPRRGSFVHDALTALREELSICRDKLHASDAKTDPESRLELRAWAIELAVRCAHAAIAVTGGSANAEDSPVQRRYREALVFTVSAQTIAVQAATLSRLAYGRATKPPLNG